MSDPGFLAVRHPDLGPFMATPVPGADTLPCVGYMILQGNVHLVANTYTQVDLSTLAVRRLSFSPPVGVAGTDLVTPVDSYLSHLVEVTSSELDEVTVDYFSPAGDAATQFYTEQIVHNGSKVASSGSYPSPLGEHFQLWLNASATADVNVKVMVTGHAMPICQGQADIWTDLGALANTAYAIALINADTIAAAEGNAIGSYALPGLASAGPLVAATGTIYTLTSNPATGDVWFVEEISTNGLLKHRSPGGVITTLYTQPRTTNPEGGFATGNSGIAYNHVDGFLYVEHVGRTEPCSLWKYDATSGARTRVYTGTDQGGIDDVWETCPTVLSDGSVIAGSRGQVNDYIVRVTTGGAVTTFATPSSPFAQSWGTAFAPIADGRFLFALGGGTKVQSDAALSTPSAADFRPGFNATESGVAWLTGYSDTYVLADPASPSPNFQGREIWRRRARGSAPPPPPPPPPPETGYPDFTVLTVLNPLEGGEVFDPGSGAPGFTLLADYSDPTLGHLFIMVRDEGTSSDGSTFSADPKFGSSYASGQDSTRTISGPNGAADVTVNFSGVCPYAMTAWHLAGVPTVAQSGTSTTVPVSMGGVTGDDQVAVLVVADLGFSIFITETTTAPGPGDQAGSSARTTNYAGSVFDASLAVRMEKPFTTNPTFSLGSGDPSFALLAYFVIHGVAS